LKLGDIKLAPERKPPTAAEQRRAVFEAKGTPLERFEGAQRDARLSHQRVLVIFAAPNDAAAEQLFALSRDRDELREMLDDFRTLWVSTEGGRLPAAQALAKKLKLELRAGAAPVLVIADERGEKLAVQDTAGLRKDGKLDGAALRQFLQREAPERLDAEKLLADALARAKKENKRVLVQETATWCGPCWRLSRFLDANRELWEKDYLWIKLDHRWDHAIDVAKRLRKGIAQGGIPWTAILDADGKILATSNAKDGQNVGFPSDAAAITHFETMLRTTALRLTPPEIARLAEALKVANAP
jgi:Thioredoxin-like